MFALVEIGGHQFKVSSNDEIFVYKLDGKEGDKEDEKDKNSTPP
ncbi:MAG TPA: bL21 family ribosomal protein, partial [Chitinophagales bacterium]|nr:bL21 family ribosomal protein [Chitinophagales bacterium]